MSRGFPQFRGFETPPGGRLLSQVVDLDGPMGLAYERSVGFDKAMHVHDRLMLVCPRGATRMRLRLPSPGQSLTVTGTTVAFVPKTCLHADEGVSVVYDTLALFPDERLVRTCSRAARLSSASLSKALAVPSLLWRSRWLDEAIERYFVARILDRAPRSNRLSFLEHEILTEALSAPGVTREGGEAPEEGQLFDRALRAIEANLFAPFDLASLGRRVGASTSSLLRAFRHEIDETPYAYVKGRRLDEARGLLERGGLHVKEVALLVGYVEVSSFSRAFRARFRAPPADFIGRGSPRVARATRRSSTARRR